MRIRYFCHYDKLTGYGRAARDYLLALHGVDGIELEIIAFGGGELGISLPPGTTVRSPEPRYSALDPLVVPWVDLAGSADVAIYHASPRALEGMTSRWRWQDDATPRHVAMTTWETRPLPEVHAAALAAYDAVIVPSHFCAAAINDARAQIAPIVTPDKVYVVPHCFDEQWWPRPAARERGTAGPIRFLSIGAWGERKNMLGVLRAYLHAFTKADDVELMLLIANPDFDDIRSVVARSGLSAEQLPALHVPEPRELTEDQLVELHQAADAYVSAARGEGWGLGMFEAAILGKRVIAPLWGGQADFLDGSPLYSHVHGTLTPCFGGLARGRIIETDRGMMQESIVSLPPGVDCKQVWYEPDLAALAGHMRRVYRQQHGLSQEDLDRERTSLEARFGYHTVGAKLSNTLKEIAWGSPQPLSTT